MYVSILMWLSTVPALALIFGRMGHEDPAGLSGKEHVGAAAAEAQDASCRKRHGLRTFVMNDVGQRRQRKTHARYHSHCVQRLRSASAQESGELGVGPRTQRTNQLRGDDSLIDEPCANEIERRVEKRVGEERERERDSEWWWKSKTSESAASSGESALGSDPTLLSSRSSHLARRALVIYPAILNRL
jgi:hypothetical protein